MADLSLDLGYRWENGEVNDWDVLVELCGGERQAHYLINSEGYGDLIDERHSWQRAGMMFDWVLNPEEHPMPWMVKNELNKFV